MSSGDGLPNVQLPRSHYFLSLARGDSFRTFALRPLALWAALALAPLAMLWGGGATLYIAFHDDLFGVLLERQAQMQIDYEDRLAEARAELDRLAGRRRLEQAAIEGRMRDVVTRQARLEQRGSIVAALAGEAVAHVADTAAQKPSGALKAVEALGGPAPADSVQSPAARAFAPEPAPAPSAAAPREHMSAIPEVRSEREVADLASGGNNPNIDAATRLSLIDHSLDRLERGQDAALGEITTAAQGTISRLTAVVAKTGLSPDALRLPEARGGVGGPFIPASTEFAAPGADKALADAARDIRSAERLRRLMPFVPVRAPLAGEASLTSPFGYRPDPFLGRPALHPGVDLVQAFGSEIHATASGRVIHAGWMGGYGQMVEIDHGNGLTTRYGHMSEVLVNEGDEVAASATLGRLGTTGRSTGPHLHYEVRIDGEPVDPQRFLQAGADFAEP
jgi:murein DD-endopeptidase MepM/ murein hydrolase activator NlpD